MRKLKNVFSIILVLVAVTLISGCLKLSLFSEEENHIYGGADLCSRIQELEERLDEMEGVVFEECDGDCEECDCEDDDDDDDDDDD